jgi:hypothetical protein
MSNEILGAIIQGLFAILAALIGVWFADYWARRRERAEPTPREKPSPGEANSPLLASAMEKEVVDGKPGGENHPVDQTLAIPSDVIAPGASGSEIVETNLPGDASEASSKDVIRAVIRNRTGVKRIMLIGGLLVAISGGALFSAMPEQWIGFPLLLLAVFWTANFAHQLYILKKLWYVKVPPLGKEKNGILVNWLRPNEGTVFEEMAIAEIETANQVYTLTLPVSPRVSGSLQHKARVGTRVTVGGTIAIIKEELPPSEWPRSYV